MLKILNITLIFVIMDFLLLKLMVGFYFSIGIPMFKRQVQIRPDRTLADIGVYLGISDYLVYKNVGKNKLIFRNKFTYITFYKVVGMLSVIKGEIKMFDGFIIIKQRINMATVYFYIMIIYLVITYHIDALGYIFLVMIILSTLVANYVQNIKLVDICNSIETYINQEKIKSSWPD